MLVRWNLTYIMLDQYIAIKPAIDLVIIQFSEEFENITITDDEINFIKELLVTLKVFSEASTEI